MTNIICPEHVQVYFDDEDTYGDGGSAGSPNFKWLGIIQDSTPEYSNQKRECRGLGSIDVLSLASGMVSPELTVRYIVQRKKSGGFDPATFLGYAKTFPTGLGLEWLATYGTGPSYLSLWYKGMQIDSLDLDWGIEDFIIATVKLGGYDVTSGVAGVGADYEPNPLDTTSSYCLPLMGFDAEVFANAAGATDAALTNVKKVSLSIKNNLVKIPVIQTANANKLKYILKSKREFIGNLVLYIEDKDELDWLLNSTLVDVRVDLQKTDNTPYFDFTNAKFDKGQLTSRINEVPCEVTLPFVAANCAFG